MPGKAKARAAAPAISSLRSSVFICLLAWRDHAGSRSFAYGLSGCSAARWSAQGQLAPGGDFGCRTWSMLRVALASRQPDHIYELDDVWMADAFSAPQNFVRPPPLKGLNRIERCLEGATSVPAIS